MLLKELCAVEGVSGNEARIRNTILTYIRDKADQVTVDTMGNIFALKKGSSHDKKILAAAPMDEIGLIVSGVTEKGYLRFKTVGDIDPRVLISKKVRVGGRIPGIIGIKAIHLQKPEERKTTPPVSELFVDIGAKTKESAEKAVKKGDYIAFERVYRETDDGMVFANGLDSRGGCAALIQAMDEPCGYDTYFCFLVQEKTGLRGSGIAAYRIRPDFAVEIGGIGCADFHEIKSHQAVPVCKKGAAPVYMDSGMITDMQVYKAMLEIAAENQIPVQEIIDSEKHNTKAIQSAAAGTAAAMIGFPCRYRNTPINGAAREDMKAAAELLRAVIRDPSRLLRK